MRRGLPRSIEAKLCQRSRINASSAARSVIVMLPRWDDTQLRRWNSVSMRPTTSRADQSSAASCCWVTAI